MPARPAWFAWFGRESAAEAAKLDLPPLWGMHGDEGRGMLLVMPSMSALSCIEAEAVFAFAPKHQLLQWFNSQQ